MERKGINKSQNNEEQAIDYQLGNFTLLSSEIKKLVSKLSLKKTIQNIGLVESIKEKLKLYYTWYSSLSNYQESGKYPDKMIEIKIKIVESVNLKYIVKLLHSNISLTFTESVLNIITALYDCLACNNYSNYKLLGLLEDHVYAVRNNSVQPLLTYLAQDISLFGDSNQIHPTTTKLNTLSILLKGNPHVIANLTKTNLLYQFLFKLFSIQLADVTKVYEDVVCKFLFCVRLIFDKGMKNCCTFFDYPEYIYCIYNILKTQNNRYIKQYCSYILSSIFEHSRDFTKKEPRSLFDEITRWLGNELTVVISNYIELEDADSTSIEIYISSLLHLYTSMCTNNETAAKTVINLKLIEKLKNTLSKEADDNYHKCKIKNKILEIAISILMPLVQLNFLKEPAQKYWSKYGLGVSLIFKLLEDINYYKEQNQMGIFCEEFTSVTFYENEFTNIYKMALILQLFVIDHMNFIDFINQINNDSLFGIFKESFKYSLQRLKESDLNIGLLYNILLLLLRVTRNKETSSIIVLLTDCDIVNFLMFFLDLFFSSHYLSYFNETQITNKIRVLLLDLLNVCTKNSKKNYEKVMEEGGIMKIIDILKFNTDNFIYVSSCLSILNNLYKEFLKEEKELVLKEIKVGGVSEPKFKDDENLMFYERSTNRKELNKRNSFMPSEGIEILNSMRKMLEDILVVMTNGYKN